MSLTDNFRCPVCRGVLREAVQTRCGHRACAQCVRDLLAGNPGGVVPCPVSDDTCVVLKEEEIHRDVSMRREIHKLEVYCNFRNEGCREILPWNALEFHLKSCEFRATPCLFMSSGCPVVTPHRDKEGHADQCEYRPVTCTHCSQQQTFRSLKSHEETECPRVVVQCPNSCGSEPCPRQKMEIHIEKECPKRPQVCKYQTMGCVFTGEEADLLRHTEVSWDNHAYLTAQHSHQVALDTAGCRKDIQEINSSLQSLTERMTDQSRQMESLISALDGFKHTLKTIKIKAVSQTERLITLERRVDNMADRELVEKQGRSVMLLTERQGTLEQRVTHLERAGPSGGEGGACQPRGESDRRLALLDARFADIDLRMQVIETVNYSGVLMWKIRDYTQRKQDAKAGKTTSLYSQPFYTGPFGYKMCARVYLNGDGMGKGTHLSLFFVVQKGEYDALLPWPFKQKVTLMLLDQQNGSRHVVDSFRPDTTSSSYQRPVTEMNIASGCPLFISHVVLETPTYLRDDTIFIKVVVDSEGLKQH